MNLTHMFKTASAIMNDGASLTDANQEIILLTAILLVFLIINVYLFSRNE